jgi:hypothetical protein
MTKTEQIKILLGFITPLEGECQLGKEPWPDQCCCVCRFLLIDYWYCLRMPEELKNKGHCGCDVVRGYICTAGWMAYIEKYRHQVIPSDETGPFDEIKMTADWLNTKGFVVVTREQWEAMQKGKP